MVAAEEPQNGGYEDALAPVLQRWYDDLTLENKHRDPGLWWLPPRHAFAHHYCFLLNDTLSTLVREAEKANLLSVSINLEQLSPEVRDEFINSELRGEDLFDWLEKHGYTDEANNLIERQVTVAVLADASQFIYEALRCSEKGKLTVSFALLRKPLRENLLLLELLLTDRDRFLEMLATSTEELGIYSLPKSERAQPIIESAVKAIGREGTFDPSFLYDLRYAKHQHFSLEGAWNKASHLVTTGKHFPTEANNLNFIFSGTEDKQSQWDGLYLRLPVLLFYFVDVAVALITRIAGPDQLEDRRASRTRELGFLLTVHFHQRSKPFNSSLLARLTLPCPLCGHPIFDDLEGTIEAYLYSRATCGACGLTISLDGETPPEWLLVLRHWMLPAILPIRRAYRALRRRAGR